MVAILYNQQNYKCVCFSERTRLTWRMYLPPTLCHTNMNCRGYDPGLRPVLWELRIRGCAGLSPGHHLYTHLPDTESMASATMKEQHPTHKVDTVHQLRGSISTHAWQRHSSRGCAALKSPLATRPVGAWVRTHRRTGVSPAQ